MIAAFSVTPLGAGGTPLGAGSTPLGAGGTAGAGATVGAVVAECVRIVRESGLPNETNAMFTNVEGEWDEVMAVLKACVDKASEAAPRVSVVVKIDVLGQDPGGRMRSKVDSVERRLGGA